MPKSAHQHQKIKGVNRSAGATASLCLLHEKFVKELRFSTRLAFSTLRGYQQVFSLLNHTMPNLDAQQFSPEAMTEFFRRLDTRPRFVRGRERHGVRASTVATYRSKLNRFCNWLKARGEIEMNPFSSMPYPRVEYEDRKYLERSQVERVLATVALGTPWRDRLVRRRNAALFAVLLYTGVRKGELLGLRVMDLDLNRLELTVRAETSKSRLRRVVPINSTLCLALEDYFAERQRRGFQCEYVFTSGQADRAFTAEGLKHLVNQVRRLSGVQFHLHQFRHTFAVNILNRGGDIAKLKQLLGHRDIRMTSAYLRCLPTASMRTNVENITLDTLL